MFYGIGLMAYDLLAGKLSVGATKILSAKKTMEALPSVKPSSLKGGILYHDGQFDDSRLAIDLAYTASIHGATILNYVSLIGFEKETKKMVAIVCKDEISGKEYVVKAKSFINATGVFTDHVMQLDEVDREPIVRPSQGIHLVVRKSFFSSSNAMMVPKTSDGRVFFAVPWHQEVVLGTTDTAIDLISEEPKPLDEEIDFIIEHFNKYNAVAIERKDVQSVFVGLRPLVKVNGTNSTALLSRDHTILVSTSGLVTITGGKWTTYRKMAEDAVNNALFVSKQKKLECITPSLKIGDPEKRLTLIDAIIVEDSSYSKQLHESFSYTIAEVIFAIRHELAETVEDILARRTRILFLNASVAKELSSFVASLLANELGKNKEWERKQVQTFQALTIQYTVY
jgi:glycerol-3-phosphate dehydrogenase